LSALKALLSYIPFRNFLAQEMNFSFKKFADLLFSHYLNVLGVEKPKIKNK
jgi:hypothetical protein